MKKILASLILLGMLTSCSQSIPNSITTSGTTTSSLPTISIVSGSENKELEPLIQRFAQKKGYDISMTYKGSLDIFQDLNDNSTSVDAIWPASSIWENLLSNTNVKLSHSESIFKTPVVFAIKNDKAQELGLIGKEIGIYDILKLITTGQLSFAMTNATQSNSGFSAFLSFLVGFSNKQDSTLTVDDLNKVTTLDQTRKLLKGVNRSSGSSNWLKDLFLSKYDSLDAMVNYESLVIDTNKELEKEGKSPLYMFYIKEGIVLSNSPLSYVDNGNTEKEKVFLELQQYLLSKDVQDEIQNLGRRTGLSLNSTLDRTIYKPEWGVKDDLTKTKQILFPSKDTFNKMLEVYLLSLKKPSYTVYVVDTSGSMEGNGLDQLKSGLKTIFNQSLAKKYFLQASPNDKSIIITFNSSIDKIFSFNGNTNEETTKALEFVNNLEAGGGTNMYLGLQKALEMINSEKDIAGYFPSIILMSDGVSDGAEILSTIKNKDIPVFPISFGESDDTQLKGVITNMVGQFFDGKANLINAFKKAKGFN